MSAWKEHVPFAMDLVAAINPRAIVELGTAAGDSYCAMCQAVQMHPHETRCWAIDTWEGDEHGGRYGPGVLKNLREHHDARYGSFSTLMKSTFSEARSSFEDGAIDLLHIDGYHTYDAVRADFEEWLPKISATGVVLFHDTNVYDRDFGVWRLWAEISATRPHFEFLHGHGLGVLAVGSDVPQPVRALCAASPEETHEIRSYYFALGQRAALMQDLEQRTSDLVSARSRIESLEAQARTLESRDVELSNRLREASALRESLEARVTMLQRREAELQHERDASNDRAMEVSARHAAITDALAQSRVWRAAQFYRAARDAAVRRLRPSRP